MTSYNLLQFKILVYDASYLLWSTTHEHNLSAPVWIWVNWLVLKKEQIPHKVYQTKFDSFDFKIGYVGAVLRQNYLDKVTRIHQEVQFKFAKTRRLDSSVSFFKYMQCPTTIVRDPSIILISSTMCNKLKNIPVLFTLHHI